MTENESSDPHPNPETQPIVIGQQLADARSAEKKWRDSGGGENSSLLIENYEFFRGDLSLIRPAPSHLDEQIRGVCRQYAIADSDERLKLRQSISMDQFYTLINFAKRSAVFGLRENNPDLVADALTATAMIEQERVDFRDILWCLGLLFHAANRAGGDADEMFRNASEIAGPEVAAFLVNFTEQSEEYRSLRESWGYDEVETDDGTGFIGWGLCDYNPSIDLKSAIVDIAEIIATDEYQPSQIEVASELPGVWLGARDSAASERLQSAIRAGATVSASLRPEKHEKHSSQQFTVFLVETASDKDAQSLCRMAEVNKLPSHSKLCVARSRLFCLVVARSFVEEVDTYETDESLKRFSNNFEAILELHAKDVDAK